MKYKLPKISKECFLKKRSALNGAILEYFLVAIFYVVLTIAYTHFAIFEGDRKLFIEEPGDATAGIVWWTGEKATDVSNAYGHTEAINYPLGADLRDPTQLTSMAIAGPLWIITRFTSPFMGANIMQILAFLLVSITTYVLCKHLTGKWYVALFAGFAATFFPYHLFKTVNHIGNIFSWVFALQLGAFLYLWKRPAGKAGVLVALSIAMGYFTDGYYLLLSTVFALTISGGIILASVILREKKARVLLILKYLLFSVATLTILVLPIIYAQLSVGSEIEQALGRSTSTIKSELRVYASTKLDFLTPPPENPFFQGQSWYHSMLDAKSQHSNPVESTLYIGYVVLALCAVGFLLFGARIAKRKCFNRVMCLTTRDDRWFVVLSCVVLVSMPVMLSFMGPDKLYKFGLTIPTLAGILTDHIALWRVLARFILPMHIMLVVYASFILYLLLQRFVRGRKKKLASIGIVVILGILCAIEYATTINTPVFDLAKMPKLYSYLNERSDIDVIAEFPLQDSPVEVNGYYATAQYIHGKKLVNNHASKYNIGQFSALGTEDNPDSIDFIKERGADAVITRDKECHTQTWGALLYSEKINLQSTYDTPPSFQPSGDDHMCLYKLDKQAPLDSSFIITSASYARENTGEYTTTLGTPTVTMRIADDEQKPIHGRTALVTVDAFSTGKLAYTWTAKQSGASIAHGELSGPSQIEIVLKVKTSDPVVIDFSLKDSNVRYVPEDIRLVNYTSTLLSQE